MLCWKSLANFHSFVVVLHILFVTVSCKQIPQNELGAARKMEEICSNVCSKNFYCNWSTWHNRLEYIFPDGTLQTCVGAQVRCGCTLSMQLISNISYEHPTAVVLPFMLGLTMIVLMLLTHIVNKGCLLWSMEESSKTIGSNRDLYGGHCHCGNVNGTDSISISSKLSKVHIDIDEPPSYSSLEVGADNPPSYKEFIQSTEGKL
ncbi:unnamed protein product [Orchesella dallaii]|uniref:Uncharacterized protein n=1 Tax=Orchesella dallaii TaxID=48710 RepID=A0ABP1S3S8_9HEXA